MSVSNRDGSEVERAKGVSILLAMTVPVLFDRELGVKLSQVVSSGQFGSSSFPGGKLSRLRVESSVLLPEGSVDVGYLPVLAT